jgi:hypothetical protein
MLFSNISLPFNDKTILPNLSQGRLAAPLSIWRLCALYTLHAGAARPWLATIIVKGKRYKVPVSHKLLSIISIETFTKQCACTYGIDVTMVADEVNKFG